MSSSPKATQLCLHQSETENKQKKQYLFTAFKILAGCIILICLAYIQLELVRSYSIQIKHEEKIRKLTLKIEDLEALFAKAVRGPTRGKLVFIFYLPRQ